MSADNSLFGQTISTFIGGAKLCFGVMVIVAFTLLLFSANLAHPAEVMSLSMSIFAIILVAVIYRYFRVLRRRRIDEESFQKVIKFIETATVNQVERGSLFERSFCLISAGKVDHKCQEALYEYAKKRGMEVFVRQGELFIVVRGSNSQDNVVKGIDLLKSVDTVVSSFVTFEDT